MQTRARKRAEELFAAFTREVDRAEEKAAMVEDQVTVHAGGPKTLHLPCDTKAELADRRTTHRSATKTSSGQRS